MKLERCEWLLASILEVRPRATGGGAHHVNRLPYGPRAQTLTEQGHRMPGGDLAPSHAQKEEAVAQGTSGAKLHAAARA